MGGNSAETLHPVTYTPIRGVGGSRDGGLLFAQIYNFFPLNCLPIVVIWGKVTLGTSKNIVYFLYSKSQGKRRFSYTTVFDKALLRGSFGLNFGGCYGIWRGYLEGKKS